jgi:hypothetical protein
VNSGAPGAYKAQVRRFIVYWQPIRGPIPRREKADRECRSDVQGTISSPGYGYEMASENIKSCWKEQGIWKDEWDNEYLLAGGLWKHREPLELEAESGTDSEAGSATPLSPPWSETKKIKSDEEKQTIAARRVIREREGKPLIRFSIRFRKGRNELKLSQDFRKRRRNLDCRYQLVPL